MTHVIRPDLGESKLNALQRHAFKYFLHETHTVNGLVADRTQPGSPASIAAVGFALAAYPVGVERAWMTRTDAIERTLAVMRFFWASRQGTASDATGFKGFYYHFLDMTTGARAQLCEVNRHSWMEARERLSTIPLGRLRRSHAPLRARSGLADVSLAHRELRGVDCQLSMEADLRL